jgi:hypothetical protein
MILSDALVPVLIGSAAFGAFIVVRFVAAMVLRPSHPLNRAAETVEAPLWALEPDGHPSPDIGGAGGDGDRC